MSLGVEDGEQENAALVSASFGDDGEEQPRSPSTEGPTPHERFFCTAARLNLKVEFVPTDETDDDEEIWIRQSRRIKFD